MNGADYVLAIDGGGTKTAAALLTWAGETLATCRTGPANLYRDPVEGLAEIRRAWEELCHLAELSPDATAAIPSSSLSAPPKLTAPESSFTTRSRNIISQTPSRPNSSNFPEFPCDYPIPDHV